MQHNDPHAFDEIKDDFDDFDDFDDEITDAEWDDLEDEAVPAEAAAKVKPKNKSFIMRYFNLIVVLVALMIGGTVVFLKFGAQTVPQQGEDLPPPTAAIQPDNDIAALPPMDDEANVPPMPVPIDSASATQAETDNSLTPLPDLTGIQQEQLPALDYAKAEQDMAQGNPMQAAANTPVKPPPSLEPLPEIEEPVPAPEPEDQPAPAPEPEEAAETPELRPVPQNPAPAPVLVQQGPVVKPEELDALEKKMTDKIAVMNKDVSSKMSGTDAKLDKLIASIETLEKKLSDTRNELKEDAKKQADKQSAALEKIASIKASAPAEPKPVKKEKPKPEPEPVIAEVQSLIPEEPVTPEVIPAPVPKPVKKKAEPVVKQQPVQTYTPPKPYVPAQPKIATQWQMRSASPGKAVVSAKGSTDFRNVSVGDTLDGVGTIQSIAQVSGRWVIQGSRGVVTQ